MIDLCVLVAASDHDIGMRLQRAMGAVGLNATQCAAPVSGSVPVLVVWSPDSTKDPQLLAGVRAARREGRLLQVGWRQGAPPRDFDGSGFVDLSAWRGGKDNQRFQQLVAAVHALKSGRPAPPGTGHWPRVSRLSTARRLAVGVASLALTTLGLVANIGGARDFMCSIPVVQRACLSWGVAKADLDASLVAPATKSAIAGTWGKPGCTRKGVFKFAGDVLVQTWPKVGDGPFFESKASVETWGVNRLTAKDLVTGQTWQITVDGRDMSLRKPNETFGTDLVRCG